jgi:hypothetical protein|tara:strand:- start:987 stop:1238 length:252 start_codon:yes stop_codon:yes gene_type:complete
MSTQPDDNEIEEGEIITDDESEDLSIIEEDEDDGETLDMADIITSLLATEDGDTVCSALVNIASQLQTQNKILIKMLSKINSA